MSNIDYVIYLLLIDSNVYTKIMAYTYSNAFKACITYRLTISEI